MCVPDSSTNTNRLTSKREASYRHRALAPSSRSWATGDFFERPLTRKPTDVAAHRGLRDLQARLVLESLAMLFEGKVGVPLQVPGQPPPQCLALHGRSTGDLADLDVPRKAPP